MKNLVLALAMCLGMSSLVNAEPAVPKSAIVLKGVITGSTLAPLNEYVANLLSADTVPEYLDMVIASPGGSVTAGFIFLDKLNALRGRGTTVRCYVGEVAASMAYQIFLACDERFALDTSFLLWHRARIFGTDGPITGPMATTLGRQLELLDAHIFRDVVRAMPEAGLGYLRFHFEAETLHTGANVGEAVPNFVTVRPYIPGLMEALNDPKRVQSAPAGFFGFRRNELIYIWNEALKGL